MLLSRSETNLSSLGLFLLAAFIAGGSALLGTIGFAQEQGGRKYALLVGVKNYDPTILKPLEFSEQDMISMQEALIALGFDVVVMTSQQEMPARVPMMPEDIIAQLDRRLRNRRKEDLVLVALSGHGVQLKSDALLPDGSKETYFCPQRADLRNLKTLLPLSEVINRMESSVAGRKLLLVDACRDEVEPLNVLDKNVEIDLDPVGPPRRRMPKGMAALFSCSPGERSFEMRQLGHSVFTYHVLRYLRGQCEPEDYPGQELLITKLADYVSRETLDYIARELDKDQIPEFFFRTSAWSLGKLKMNPNVNSGLEVGSSLMDKVVMSRTAPPKPDAIEPMPRTLVNSVGAKMRLIPPGAFMMGAAETDLDAHADEKPQHRVRFSHPFYIGETEVTQGQWKLLMGTEPWKEQISVREGDNFPATYISWEDAALYCQRLSKLEGREYRLPRESEWEYACRGDSTTSYSFGDNAADLSRYCWYANNVEAAGEEYAHEVKLKFPNSLGLYDMHGNVIEWCSDIYGEYLYGSHKNPSSAFNSTERVRRGGGWLDQASQCRSSFRDSAPASTKNYALGFRLLMIPSSEKP